ncbi:MAG: hypothetical protein EAZ57_09595 [Cytophagales bacterium]|nr:MAG: hypothetical protein EAZ67_01375 [Cytophagales bacterium]TAF59891.1 MAG: hypothetical protein EAZ57_09595 [Cytophagales bacterium]
MELIADLAKILLPAGLVLYGAYLLTRSIMTNDIKKAQLEYRIKNVANVLPYRLQAYERMSIFLERILLGNLIPRVLEPGMSAALLQQLLIMHIREEFNHNLSQQIYMGDATWQLVKSSIEDTITLINEGAKALNEAATGNDLARLLLEHETVRTHNQTETALKFLKEEISQIF